MSGDVAELGREADALPDGWRSHRLGDLATLSGGTTPSRVEPVYWKDATIPWATPSDITSLPAGVSRIADTETKVSERALAECSLALNPPGTVLMTSRATIGLVAVNDVPMATNQGFITFRAGDKLDASFLLYWLTAQRGNLVAAAGGSTFKELSRGTAKLLPILLPPLDEQRRIAEVLRSVDEAIAASQLSLEQGQRTREVIRDADFAAQGRRRRVTLGSVCEITKLAGFEYTKHIRYGEGDEIIAIRGLNIKDGRLLLDDIKTITLTASKSLPRSSLRKGDLVMSYVGTIGEVAKIDEDDRFHLAPNVALLRCSDHVMPEYILHFLYSRTGREQINKHVATSSQQSLSMSKIRSFEIALPSLDEQRHVVATMDALGASLRAGMDVHSQLLANKSNLMSDLLSGRVRVLA